MPTLEEEQIQRLVNSWITQAVAQERERCAKIAESMSSLDADFTEENTEGYQIAKDEIAARIRSGE